MAISYNTSIVRDGLVLCLDAANPKSYSPNVFTYPLDAFAWAGPGGGFQMTLTRDSSVTDSPAGGTPLKIVTSGASAYTGTYNSSTWNLAPAAVGQTWTFSFWVKGTTAHSASLMIFEANSAGNYTALGQIFYNVTTSWTRVSGSYTMTQATTAFVQTRIDDYNTGVTIWVDGLQLERTSSVGNFNPRTNVNGLQWQDLSGNNNHHSIIGAPTFANGRFTLNETQGFQKNSAMTGVGTSCTVVIWYATTDTQELWVKGNNSGGVYLSASAGNNYYHAGCGTPTNFVDLAVTVRPDSPINYRNGAYHMWEAKNVDFTTWTVYDWFLYGAGWNMIGTVSTIMIYNRTLTAGESVTNFAALRGRYGI
jgi:hypothetical protein